jgi:hypothetical protein
MHRNVAALLQGCTLMPHFIGHIIINKEYISQPTKKSMSEEI